MNKSIKPPEELELKNGNWTYTACEAVKFEGKWYVEANMSYSLTRADAIKVAAWLVEFTEFTKGAK